jgi:hypothetical protein
MKKGVIVVTASVAVAVGDPSKPAGATSARIFCRRLNRFRPVIEQRNHDRKWEILVISWIAAYYLFDPFSVGSNPRLSSGDVSPIMVGCIKVAAILYLRERA